MTDEAAYRRSLRAARRALRPKVLCACGLAPRSRRHAPTSAFTRPPADSERIDGHITVTEQAKRTRSVTDPL